MLKKKQRDSNLELFRIITMLLIVAHHYVVNSGIHVSMYENPFAYRSLYLFVFGAWGKIGINCFVLITGYFMCRSNITAKKFVKLLFEVLFYRIVLNSIFWVTGYADFSLTGLIKILIPVSSIGDGFTPAYLVFFLLIPFLNVLVKSMNEKQHIRLLLVCLFVYTFLGTVPGFGVRMNYVSWFCVLYLVSSYIRLYPRKCFESTKLWGILTAVFVCISVVSVILCVWYGARTGSNMAFRFVADSNTFLALAVAVCAFMFFKNLKLKNNSFINAVAATTFGVFLIHANSSTMRSWLWGEVLNVSGAYNLPMIYLHAIGSVLAVFIVCSAIDMLRIHFVETPLFKLWDRHWDKISGKFKSAEKKLCDKLKISD